MSSESFQQFIGQLRVSAMLNDQSLLNDEQLLERYLTSKDEAAFECLLWRHGPMVFGVCWRILQNSSDAEDAFQATFLVLVRKASSLVPRSQVGAWLHGVASHIALKARSMKQKQYEKEREIASPEVQQKSSDWELHQLVDEEVNRLPEKYRIPIILCELQGRGIVETAQDLGWPQGTVASRLSRGRELLAKRLTRYRFSGTGASLALTTLTPSVAISIPQVQKSITLSHVSPDSIPTVSPLAEGMLRTMYHHKIYKAILAILGSLFVLVGGGLVYTSMQSSAGEDSSQKETKVNKASGESNPIQKQLETMKEPIENNPISWGNQVDGLQLGVSYPKGSKMVYEVNETVTFHVYLRNITKKEIEYSIVTAPREILFNSLAMPQIENTQEGKGNSKLRVNAITPDSKDLLLDKRKVAPETTVLLGKSSFEIKPFPAKPTGKTIEPVPGSYRVYYAGLWINDDWKGEKYRTGFLDFIIKPHQTDFRRLMGRWRVIREEKNGKLLVSKLRALEFTVKDTCILEMVDEPFPLVPGYRFEIDEQKKTIDFNLLKEKSNNPGVGIYELKGNRLRICLGGDWFYPSLPQKYARPKEFKTHKDNMLFDLEKETITWGPFLNEKNVSFGFSMTPELPEYRIGDLVTFRTYARNPTADVVEIEMPELNPLREFSRPNMLDNQKNPVKFALNWPDGKTSPIQYRKYKIAPKGVMELGSLMWQLYSPSMKFDVTKNSGIEVVPGMYQISFSDLSSTGKPKCSTESREIRILGDNEAYTDRNGIAWGKEQGGLQFGLAIGEKNQRSFPINSILEMIIYVRNKTDKDITHRWTSENHFSIVCLPTILDPNEKAQYVRGMPGFPGIPGIEAITIKAGETKVLRKPSFHWFENRPLGQFDGNMSIQAKPGKYMIAYQDLSPRDRIRDHSKWSTGWLTIEITNTKN